MSREPQTPDPWQGVRALGPVWPSDRVTVPRLYDADAVDRARALAEQQHQQELARLREELREAQQQRDQMRALLDRLVMTTRELESARPFDEWVDARAKRTEAINAAERVLAAPAKESGRWRSRSVISGSTGA